MVKEGFPWENTRMTSVGWMEFMRWSWIIHAVEAAAAVSPVAGGNRTSMNDWEQPGRERLLREGGRGWRHRLEWDKRVPSRSGGRVLISSKEESNLLLCFKSECNVIRFVCSKFWCRCGEQFGAGPVWLWETIREVIAIENRSPDQVSVRSWRKVDRLKRWNW